MAIYLEEFLFRGRPPGSEDAPTYHVVLGQLQEDAFGNKRLTTSPPMTPDEAAAKGFSLPDILAAINASTMAENAALKARIDELAELAAGQKEEIETLRADIQTLTEPAPGA